MPEFQNQRWPVLSEIQPDFLKITRRPQMAVALGRGSIHKDAHLDEVHGATEAVRAAHARRDLTASRLQLKAPARCVFDIFWSDVTHSCAPATQGKAPSGRGHEVDATAHVSAAHGRQRGVLLGQAASRSSLKGASELQVPQEPPHPSSPHSKPKTSQLGTQGWSSAL